MKIDLKASKSWHAEVNGVGCFEGEKEKYSNSRFSGKCGETLLLPKSGGSILLIGLGKKQKYSRNTVRKAAAKVLAQAKALKAKTAAVHLDSFYGDLAAAETVAAAAEGARLADYRFDRYKSKGGAKSPFQTLTLVTRDSRRLPELKKALLNAEIIADAVYFTRDLANEPPNILTPSRLADSAKKMAAQNGLDCRVFGRAEMKKLGMGGVLAVSQGSAEEPRFIILENRVKNPRFKQPVVLVGKGITFDTGGISIKPSNNMDHMKFDMCGAAAVIGAMKAIARLKLPIKVIALAPTCENMPGGKAQRPGDIITCLNGKTVEVLNTDAEGRLILADALAYAKRFNPMALVDAATLTGACAAAFGDICTGLMSTDPALTERLKSCGERAGERLWELPLWDEYFELIRATYADIQNISKKSSGAITAGMFLKEFADHTRSWAHLDIAGTAWNEGGPKPLSPIGATGVGVRLFVELVKSYL